MFATSFAAASVLFITIIGLLYRKISARNASLPPGPPPDSWIFGNKLPPAFSYRKFEEWAKQYGPIFSLRQGLTTIVVVARYEAAVEIMEREGSALADRPNMIAAGEILSGGMRVMFTHTGERFKKMRKVLHTYLSPKVVQTYGPLMMNSAKEYILDVLESPEIHQQHARRYATSVVMALAYAKKPGKHDDPDVVAVNKCLVTLGITLRPGAWQVDNYPILRYVPGYLNELVEGFKEERAVFTKHIVEIKKQMEAGISLPDSFSLYLLQRQQELGLTDVETAYLAGALYGAGSDTTASAISVSVLAAARYPEAARRIQEELDQVVGRTRLPRPEDWEHGMPQLRAWVLETFRWRPVTAGAFPHRATKPIVYKNYVIPEGTTVYGNVWSVGRDPEYFPDPEAFNPQRWIREDGTIRDDLKSFPFGWGRRACPGQYMATASVMLNTALTQWAFNVREDPKYPIDELAFTESANAHPVPFRVTFEPRWEGGNQKLMDMLAEYGSVEGNKWS